MSSLLEQAIIDAKLLKETARKNAETAILDHYKGEIEQRLQTLLEQDESIGESPDVPAMDLEPTPAPAGDMMNGGEATPETKKVVEKIPAAYLGEDNSQEIEINLDSIVEKIDSMQKDLNITAPDMTQPAHTELQESVEELSEESADDSGDEVNEVNCQEEGELEEELQEEDLEETFQIDEEMVVDLGNDLAGGIHANKTELKRQENIAKVLAAQNEELKEELRAREEQLSSLEEKLGSIFSTLKETKEKLKKSTEINVKLKEGFEFVSKKINDVNLLNARLLYTNKVLGNSSLNERQKQSIAESISKSKSVEEAKTIYETLQKSVQVVAEKRQTPQSLTEAVQRAPSAFFTQNGESSRYDPVKERWLRIAGIKK